MIKEVGYTDNHWTNWDGGGSMTTGIDTTFDASGCFTDLELLNRCSSIT